MGKLFFIWTLLFTLTISPVVGQVGESSTGLIPPPAIHIPYGGKIITDINFSDGDILGIVKQVLPSIGNLIVEIAPKAIGTGGAHAKEAAELRTALSSLNFKELSEAIGGIKNIRAIVAVYGNNISPDRMLEQWDKGVAKIGTFSRVVSNIAMPNGAFALYAQPDNSGYIGFAYDPGSKVLYAMRIVGFVDLSKITKWTAEAARFIMGAELSSEQSDGSQIPEALPDCAPAEAR